MLCIGIGEFISFALVANLLQTIVELNLLSPEASRASHPRAAAASSGSSCNHMAAQLCVSSGQYRVTACKYVGCFTECLFSD